MKMLFWGNLLLAYLKKKKTDLVAFLCKWQDTFQLSQAVS